MKPNLDQWLAQHGGTVRPARPPEGLYARLKRVAELVHGAPEADEHLPRVLWRDGDGRICGRVVRGKCVIGRQRDCDVRIDLPRVSRRHCEIWSEKSEVWIRDLGSTNLTWVNGRPINRPTALRDGDWIELGEVGMAFCAPEEMSVKAEQA